MASLLFDCLFLNGLTKKEERLLFSLLDWKEISVQEWTEAGRFPESNSGQIVVRKMIEVDSLQTAIDWSKQPLLIGRIESSPLKKLFQQGLNYFFRSSNLSDHRYPVGKCSAKKRIEFDRNRARFTFVSKNSGSSQSSRMGDDSL